MSLQSGIEKTLPLRWRRPFIEFIDGQGAYRMRQIGPFQQVPGSLGSFGNEVFKPVHQGNRIRRKRVQGIRAQRSR